MPRSNSGINISIMFKINLIKERRRRVSSSRSGSWSKSHSRRRNHNRHNNSRRIRRDSRSRSISPKNKGNILYITNLSARVKERHIRSKFEKFGELEDVNLVTDPYTG